MQGNRLLVSLYRVKARVFAGILDEATIFWAGLFGAIFGALYAFGPRLVHKGWGRLSGGQQYLIAGIVFISALFSPFMIGAYVLSDYFGYQAWFLVAPVSMALVRSLQVTEDGSDNFLQRFQHKHFTIRMLWRDSRTRTCKQCGYYDGSTRELDSAPRVFQSIHDPCPNCGGTDFELHMLDTR